MSMATKDEYMDELFAEIQTPDPVQGCFRNILDEPIPEALKRRLLKSLLAGKCRSNPTTSRKEKKKKRKAFWRSFIHIPLSKFSKLPRTTRRRFLFCCRRTYLQVDTAGTRELLAELADGCSPIAPPLFQRRSKRFLSGCALSDP